MLMDPHHSQQNSAPLFCHLHLLLCKRKLITKMSEVIKLGSSVIKGVGLTAYDSTAPGAIFNYYYYGFFFKQTITEDMSWIQTRIVQVEGEHPQTHRFVPIS